MSSRQATVACLWCELRQSPVNTPGSQCMASSHLEPSRHLCNTKLKKAKVKADCSTQTAPQLRKAGSSLQQASGSTSARAQLHGTNRAIGPNRKIRSQISSLGPSETQIFGQTIVQLAAKQKITGICRFANTSMYQDMGIMQSQLWVYKCFSLVKLIPIHVYTTSTHQTEPPPNNLETTPHWY